MRLIVPVAMLLVCTTCTATRHEASSGQTERGWVTVDKGRLYYEAEGEGPPVILLHGGFGDRRMWDDQVRAMAASFRVIRYDHRGFGQSSAPEASYSPVDDLVRLLDQLDVSRAHLVGNSMGGALALEFALLHPERTDRVVVIASGANGYPAPEADVERVLAVFRAARERSTEVAAGLWLQHPMVAVAMADTAVAARLRTMVQENQRVFLMEHWPIQLTDPPAFERLGALRAPVLFVVGKRDTPLVQRAVAESAERTPRSRMEVIEAADHLPQMEQPERVSQLIMAFLRGDE